MTPFVKKNPDVMRLPKKRARRVQTKIAYMSDEQIESFLKAARTFGPREYAMFLVALGHGMRANEICLLKISDIDTKNEQIHIARLKGSLQSTQTLMKFKGNPLFNEVAALKAWLGVRQPDTGDFVFNSQKATRLNRTTVYKLFKSIARKAGLPETLQHPHVLKHSCAMMMVRRGANAFMIRQHLGHRSFQSTLSYVNPTDHEASQAAIESFAKAFG
jgi:integrase/recombinase XerD